MNLSEVLLRYLYERLINIQHGEMIPLSHGKLPVLPRLTTHRNTLYWDKYIKWFLKQKEQQQTQTYSCFPLIVWHREKVLNLHHGRDGDDLLGAAEVSRLQQHLGKHGAERELGHPHPHRVGETPVLIQTCQKHIE